jgi:hypothetical protein
MLFKAAALLSINPATIRAAEKPRSTRRPVTWGSDENYFAGTATIRRLFFAISS